MNLNLSRNENALIELIDCKIELMPSENVHLLMRKLPPLIQPFVLELVAVDVIALVPPRFALLLLLLKPGGGPRAPALFAIGALHNSD